MTKLPPAWVRTSDPARYRWTTAPADQTCNKDNKITLNKDVDDKDIASSTSDNTTDSKTKLVIG